jgi:Protein of unknown function (DUF3141)
MGETTSGFSAIQEYGIDAWQRSILVLDALRERGDKYIERASQEAPHVLGFPAEIIRDGRTLERPVNYLLVRIVSPAGAKIDPAKPPVVVVDPRAGHGPGIGGMKSESEIGEALKAGHACYFIGFLPNPMPGQTIEDVCRAEAIFIAEVAARHSAAEGKPIVIANCQAGWQTMIMAAINPDLAGPIMLAGSPLSYWTGVRGKNPMRYTGGVLGGTWMTALAGDLGNGIFDGAHLVANFESLNPANTYWAKAYNVYSKVDTEVDRFLEFETWWGSPVLLNAAEMQWIADNLFVGDKLSTGQIRTSDGLRIDLRNVKSPIIVFCSWGDNITPPQQALGWILDLYDDVNEIVANGQTIIYTMHESVGHLGIFVSGKVAAKEHGEFVSCMDLIDVAPPGLYEAIISDVDGNTVNPDLAGGKYLFRLERRTLAGIRALGGNDGADDMRFATAARVSEVNLGLYRTLAQPAIRSIVTEPIAEALRALHPHRLRFGSLSDQSPLMLPIKPLAEAIRAHRMPMGKDNPFRAIEQAASSWITAWLRTWGDIRDSMTEAVFLSCYGSPLLQATVGLGGQGAAPLPRIERDLARESAMAELRSRLERRFETGDAAEAALRALIYVRLPEGAIDERGFRMLRIMRDARAVSDQVSLPRFKAMAREQMQLVLLDEERAIHALPRLLSPEGPKAATALKALRQLLSARGSLEGESKARFARIEALLGADAPAIGSRSVARG